MRSGLPSGLGLPQARGLCYGTIFKLPLRRENQQTQWPADIQKILGKLRHRVETVFSVMTTAFNVRFPHGHSFTGFVACTATKMLAYTISFFLARLFAA